MKLVHAKAKETMSPAGEWFITGVDPADAAAYLTKHQPWRRELQFAGGPKSSDFETTTPFARGPLIKLRIVLPYIPESALSGRVLDVGSNLGHHALFLAQTFGARAVGIEFASTYKRSSEELAALMGVDAQFLIADAEEYEEPEGFDLVLHFGTLYHLRNPVRSLEKAFRSLKKGGWFALETVRYKSDDPTLCKWIYKFGGDATNSWALGSGVVQSIADYCGMGTLSLVHESEQTAGHRYGESYEDQLSRCVWVGQKKE
jgi:SAM-dependent methyltransferase